ncbi:TPA: replication initiation protein [Campylobacter coli]|uniref:Replication initiation protein n=1 Tax=Campylobacter coli TaxID=195 RepID=A0A6F9J2Y8_CAMCO|nr:replication initiation protein [Campylobacter coli]EAI3771411.1 replication initiation protein [Campylobacter coli]EAI4820154.1 replication initiation protein [Campylobacter coli]EAJ0295115.1 replication initiation protein [Campylobacter coli]EAJ8015197.1 replication initiation protein [Campylobacter coli]EAK4936666.1 replication initiation protein [Campylobacter coli]
MSEIVKYHNDFNKIKLPSFTEQEQNLLCFLLTKIKEKEENEIFSIYPKDLIGFSGKNLSNRELTEILNSFEEKFFKADFTIIVKDEVKNLIGKMRVNLFNHFVIWKETRTDWDMEIGDGLFWQEFTRIDIEVNKHFEYLINQLTANFTAFELAEFIALSGKYTKTLYRLLKQFRTTGKAYFEWEEFKRIMDIPENYEMHNIDKWILKPAIKELSKERNLFDQIRVPFKNLAYEKEKTAGRGRGGKVSGISFTFKPENIEMQKLENESQKIMSDEQKYLKILNNMKLNQVRFDYNDKFWQFNDFDFDEFKIIAIELVRDEYENLNFGNHMHFNAKNQEQFFKMIDTFRKGIR